MKIKTKFFGEIEISESEAILFPFGIYGFEEYNKFFLLHDEDEEDGLFMWLQSADDENLCFIVIEPQRIDSEYSPYIPSETLRKIGANTDESIRYAVMSVIREDIRESTVNLLSPLVINPANKTAVQVVLDPSEPRNCRYKTRHNLFSMLTFAASSRSGDSDSEEEI